MRIFGKNTCLEFLNTNKKVNKIYLQKNFDENLTLDIKSRYQNVFLVEKGFLNKLTNFKNHQGIVMEIEDFKYSSLDEILLIHKQKGTRAFIVILDEIEDPQNLGSLIRTSACAGVDGIIIPKNRSAKINETVYKVSVGATNYVKICEVTNLNDAIKKIKEQNIFVYALEAGETSIYNVDLAYDIALVVGSEGKGVSKLTKKICDDVVSLPMHSTINSLNASVAGAIGIYEVVRQRN